MTDDRGWSPTEEPVFEEDRSNAQINGLLVMLGTTSKRVGDLGCGQGRVVVPLTTAGHEVIGIDCDQAQLDTCTAKVQAQGGSAVLVNGDFREDLPEAFSGLDLMVCLGNTFMLITDPSEAVAVLRSWRARLAVGGAVVLDDLPQDLLGELTSGNWRAGFTDDGGLQIAWASDDLVFALRHGDAVDPHRENPGPNDTPLRLWTMGLLGLVAQEAGFQPPAWDQEAGLLVLGTG